MQSDTKESGTRDPVERTPANASVTELISQANCSVPTAVNRLFDLLYADLYRLAHNRVRNESNSGDLSATLLVHETYERLVRLKRLDVSDRKQFFAYAATAMRSVIVDMARSRLSERAGGDAQFVPLDTYLESSLSIPIDETVIRIHGALDALESLDPRLARVVELRYFAGLNVKEAAEVLNVAERTVARDWDKARALIAAMLVE
jgi:RNA polymerase sigma factor (TIGR02999 family)